MTLDGMDLSSIDILKKNRESGSVLLKMIPAKKLKGFHSKFRSETPKKNCRILEAELATTQKAIKEEKSVEKPTTASKDRSVINDIKESIETTLNHKMRILEKDLKKKRIEYTIRKQQYTDQLSKLNEKKENESIRVLNYELLNNPRYEFDAQEIENVQQRNRIIKDQFNKCLTVVPDDNIRSLLNMIKTNLDTQFKYLVENAERSLKSIHKIKSSFESPINEMVKRLNAQDFELSIQGQKYEEQIEAQKQLIEDLKIELK